MNQAAADELHYLRIPDSFGGRAEMVRLCYVLAERPYVDVLHPFSDAKTAVAGKNPFLQYPFVRTPSGEYLAQTLAIMHHAAHGTPAWPSEPARLTRALTVAQGAYDLYQAFGAFAATDLVAKQKFEERRAPQYMNALSVLYTESPFAAGDSPCFADCLTREAIAWCVRRNERSRIIYEGLPALVAFMARFDALPRVSAFLARQAKAREADNTV